jgi:ribulose-5-phosphate 4-epimerase/fuculose-1-phosphate aldolase
MIMGNHGILTIGDSVAETFNRLYYFERAARNYIQALQTGQPLRILPDDLAEKTAKQLDAYPEQGIRHFDELLAILDREEPEFRD